MADLDFTVNADTRAAQKNLQQLEKSISGVANAAGKVKQGIQVAVDNSKAMAAFKVLESKIKALQTQVSTLTKTPITANTTNAVNNIAKVGKEADTSGSKLNNLRNILTAVIGSAVVVNAIRYADALKDISDATGISTTALIGFSSAVEDNGGDSAKAGDAILKLVQNMNDAATGSKQIEAAFAKVGVSLGDLATMSEEDILGRVLSGLKNVSSASEQVYLKTVLLGKSFRTVGVDKLADDYRRAAEESRKYASAVDAASAAQGNVDVGLQRFRLNVLKLIEPITNFVGSFSTAQIQQFTDSLGNLLVPLGSILIVLRALTALQASYAAAAATAAAATAAAGTAAAATAVGFAKWIPQVRLLMIALGLLTVAIEYISPRSFTGMLEGFGAAIDRLNAFKKSAKDAASEANKTVETFSRLNITPSTAGAGRGSYAGYDAGADQTNKAAAETQRLDEVRKKLGDTFEKEADAIRKVASEYAKLGQENAKRFNLETSLIGLSEKSRNQAQMTADIVNRATEERTKLEEQASNLRKSNLDSDKLRLKEVETAIAGVNAEEKKQLATVNQLTAAREKATQQNNLSIFSNQQSAQNEQKLADIRNQMAKVGLPELAGKIKDLEAATRANAEAAIREEEVRRGGKLSQDEKLKYYKAASMGAIELVNATRELAAAQEEYNQKMAVENFMGKEIIDTQEKIRDIQDDMAKSTMTDIERKYYDIEAAAKKNARAAIQAENARRKAAGSALLSATEEAAYYEIAAHQSKKLTDAQKEQVEQSRKFSTGWERSYKQYIEDAGNAAKTAENIFKKATSGMEDAIVGFAKTGKFEWKSFVGSLAEELLRSEIKSIFGDMMNWMTGKTTDTTSMIGKAFGSMMGGAGQQGAGSPTQQGGGSSGLGNILDGIGNIFGGSGGGGGILESIGSGIKDIFGGFFANGGNLAAGKFGIVGERGPEMISGPATITPMQPTAVTYNINAVDAASFKALVAADPSFIYAVSMQGAKGIPGGR